ncbi:MAG: DinB family protein [Blastocatellales bacterium]
MKPSEQLIASYAEQADKLEQLISGLSVEFVSRRTEKNGWSILEIACHLADAELLASVRIRRIITQDRPNLWGYRQEDWAERLNYPKLELATILRRFALLRRENAGLMGNLPDEIWQQTGNHDQYGTLSLSQLIEDYVAHTAKHLDQAHGVAVEITDRDGKMKGMAMAKAQEKAPQLKDVKGNHEGAKSKKDKMIKDKNGKALVGRVKKVVKKSRRKLGEEKFEKELQRTITFLEELQNRITNGGNGQPDDKPVKKAKPSRKNDSKTKAKKASKKDKADKKKAGTETAADVQAEAAAATE